MLPSTVDIVQTEVWPFLAVTPFVTRLRKHVSGTCEHLHLGFTIGKQCRPVFLFAYAFAAPMLFLVLRMSLAVICPLSRLALFILDEGGSFLPGLGDGKSFESQSHLFKSFVQTLHDMETIDDDGCFGKALSGNAEHRITEVHCCLRDLFTLRPGNLLQDSEHDMSLRSFDYSYDGAFLSMSCLV